MASFGRQLREESFLLDPDVVCINHGSYGTVPKPVLEFQRSLQSDIERHPDGFYRRTNPRLHRQNLTALCDQIGAKVKDTVFVENTTTGMNCVVQSLKLTGDDAVLISSLQYHSFMKIAQEFAPKVVKVNIPFPIRSEEDILRPYQECLDKHQNIKLALLDHITSPTSVLMPLQQLAALCRSRGVISAVDGAHVVGQMPLNIRDLGVDFYAGNIHKWLFTPRGCSYLWVDPRHQHIIRPCTVSHFHGVGLHFDFVATATRDHTPFHCVEAAIDFQKQLGGLAAIVPYVTRLLDDAVADLEKAWHTERLPIARHLQAPFMRLVRVPAMTNYEKSSVGAGDLDFALFDKFKIQSLCMLIDGELYVRLSAHVYNDMEDYRKLRDAVLAMRDEPKQPKVHKGYQLPIMHWDMSMWANEVQQSSKL